VSLACHREAADPQAVFDRIQLDFRHAKLAKAQAEAHQEFVRFSDEDPAWAWKFRLLEAEVAAYRGLNQEALSTLTPELPSPLTTSDLAVKQRLLRALVLSTMGRPEPANRDLELAEQLCRTSQCSLAGQLARVGGVVEFSQNHVEKAELYFLDSLRFARRQQDRFLESAALLNMSAVALAREHFDEAIDWAERAQRLAKDVGSYLDEEKAVGNLGWAHYKMGDFELSSEYFAKAAQMAHDLGVVKDETIWLNNSGLVYFRTGELELARKYYLQSFDLARKTQNSERILDSLNALAFLSLRNGQLDEARRYSGDARELSKRIGDRNGELYATLAEGQIAAASADLAEAERLLLEVTRDAGGDASLRWEAQNSLARLYEAERRNGAAEKQYRVALVTVENARSAIRHEDFRLPFLANAAHLYDDYIYFLVSQGRTVAALQHADYSRAQTLREGLDMRGTSVSRGNQPLSVQAIAARAHATILFYWLAPQHSYVWAITPKRTVLRQLPPAKEVDEAVARYRKALLASRDPVETGNSDGVALYQMLIAPVEDLIPRNSRVIVVPDGSLDALNFETLLAPRPQPHYWIEDVTISNASSLRLLSTPARPASAFKRKLLLIGDPLISDGTFPELPKASVEMEQIAQHFSPEQRLVYAKAEATPQAYLESHPEQFSLIHFVAHGTASRTNPLESSVVLSGTGRGDDSFKLYARDIVRRRLQADLVTISTCYGSGTRYYTGEGLVGLSWAFLRAGAHSVIGALWEVSDASTPPLMDALYAELEKGQTPDAALRAAKVSLLHSNGVFRKPFYWAPFQLYTSS